MKYLKSIDFAGQTIIWLVLFGASLVISSSGKGWGDIAYFGLICQFFMGCWQMASSFLCMVSGAEHFKWRFIHFISGLFCLGLIGVSAWVDKEFRSTSSSAFVIVSAFVIPWCLAIFYYTITWRWMFPKQYTGKFLNHINF